MRASLLALLLAKPTAHTTRLHPRINAAPQCCAQTPTVVDFVNPLEVDGFAEPGGWQGRETAESSPPPLLYFFPGMDGSLATPFMQYPELGTTFELRRRMS